MPCPCPAGFSASSLSAAAESAKGDQGAAIRDLAGDHESPAGAIKQDNFVDNGKGHTIALLYNAATTADQDAFARVLAQYRDFAGGILQDKASGGFVHHATRMRLIHGVGL